MIEDKDTKEMKLEKIENIYNMV